MESVGRALRENAAVQVAEIILVFLAAVLVLAVGWPFAGDGLLARQGVVWVANVLMLLTIWTGLRLRGQTWEHFGLSFLFPGWRPVISNILKSIAVFIVAITAFILGSILMGVTSQSGQADLSSYQWLQGNLPMLLLALAAVYIVSSFGEEVIYRGFLINRVAELGGGSKFAYGIAVVVSSGIFGLIHFDWGPVGVVQTTFMGLALAISYLVLKKNLWVLILAHAYMDTLLLVPIYLSPV